MYLMESTSVHAMLGWQNAGATRVGAEEKEAAVKLCMLAEMSTV